MATSPLKAAGYLYVNVDDCWPLANRTADGHQIANPDKFPAGFAAVADFIHGLGLKSGLYTAKGTTTCAGFAASCGHEVEDALQWASWGIDYVKVRARGAEWLYAARRFCGAAPPPSAERALRSNRAHAGGVRPSTSSSCPSALAPAPAAGRQLLLLRQQD